MDLAFYQTACYLLLAFAFGAYLILDGFDLGAALLLPFVKKDSDRAQMYEALAPFWDGNEVWLIIAGATLFAAFPLAYAAALSAFYLPVILLAVCLMFRAVSFEYRHHFPSAPRLFDGFFTASSAGIGIILAVALGNVVAGVPIDVAGDYRGTLLGLFGVFPLITAAAGVALLLVLGISFVAYRTVGELRGRMFRLALPVGGIYTLLILVFFAALFGAADLSPAKVWAALAMAASVASAAVWIGFARKKRPKKMLILAALSGAFAWISIVAVQFPNLVATESEFHLTAATAASEIGTLRIATAVAGIGFVCITLMTAVVYRVFKGTVKPHADRHH